MKQCGSSIIFYNPGNLYGKVTIDALGKDNYTSELRNKLVAEAFYLTKDIEKYGTGFFRVWKELKEYPTMNFQYREQGGGFVTELTYKEQKVSTVLPDDTVNGTVNYDRLQMILVEISKNNRLPIDELANAVGVSRRTLIRDLNKLKEQGLIVRIGSDKAGHWEIL
jgi:ATP-dependent DNA helicase RecG